MSVPHTISNKKLAKIMTKPINQVFRFFTEQLPLEVWLVDQPDIRITGVIKGFDEYMNIVLDYAVEINSKKHSKVNLGQILLKGENITLLAPLDEIAKEEPPSDPPRRNSAGGAK